MSKEEFIDKAKKVHEGEGLNYSKVTYKNNRTPVCIIDPLYGEFWQTPSNHLKGQMHPKRRGKRISQSKSGKQEDIIERFKEVHLNEGLDYSKVEYKNMHTKVCIIDPDYGEYWQEPIVHLKGCGHPLRGIDKNHDKSRMTTEEFISKAKKVHGEGKYSYEKSEYNGYKEKITICCHKQDKKGKEHGYFEITPDNFLHGKGCPKCGNQLSVGENEIREFLNKNNVIFIKNDRNALNGLELDLYIPSLKIGIEYNGLRWHSEKFKERNYHLDKLNKCKENGIRLISIFEDEYQKNRDIVYSKLSHLIGNDLNLPKIDGRKCIIKEINKEESKIFLEKNHIQGFVGSSIYIGAFYNEILVGTMLFKKYSNGIWELTRFASDNNFSCRGVGGKLFKYFISKYNPYEIKSFADRRWTINEDRNIYTLLGFNFEGYTKPEYRYIVNGERKHKFGFRKQILHKKYGLPLTMTETEMAKELGFDRIWDCGLIKYVWKKEK